MTLFEKVVAVVNIAALIIVPIAAVLIGQLIQDRSEKRKDKMEIFKILMMTRYNWTAESVRALNIIDVVFAKDAKVRNAWKSCYDIVCLPSYSVQQLNLAQDKLLEAMATSLGYKSSITWETIQNPYYPKFFTDAMQQQRNINNGQEMLADLVLQMQRNGFPQVNHTEEPKDADA